MRWPFLFLMFFGTAYSYSIVFVHIGDRLPAHLPITISQARTFNKDCPIYLITNERAYKENANSEQMQLLEKDRVCFVSCESLIPTARHLEFKRNPFHDMTHNGWWIYTSERFFYLEELINQHQLTDVFHLENDIMLYVDLSTMLPVFQKHYGGMIGATFEADDRGVGALVYVSNGTPIREFVHTFPEFIDINHTDMETLARFKNQFQGTWIDFLPIIMPEYAIDHPFEQRRAVDPAPYSNHINEFGSIFDGAALGVYLGGWDPQYHPNNAEPGEIDVSCVFNPSHFSYQWKRDEEGRQVPFLIYKDKEWRINNLHLTNKKRLPSFHSLTIGKS